MFEVKFMNIKKIKTTGILLIIGLSTLMMLAVSAIAEDIEEQRINPDEEIVIAPAPEEITDEQPVEEQITEPWIPDYDPNEFIGITTQEDGSKSIENSKDENIDSASYQVFGAIAGFVFVAGLLIVHKREK